MQCPSCGAEMGTREGPYGPFYYCPHQYKRGEERCSQPTITKNESVVKDKLLARVFNYKPIKSYAQINSEEREANRKSRERDWETADMCPHCGDRAGFSWGTGDCGCAPDRE